MYCRLLGSTSTLMPWLSNSRSSGFAWSANSSLYARPEQPEVRTPTRRPTPLPRLDSERCTWPAAFSVSVIAITPPFSLFLHRRQRQLLRDVRVLDLGRLVERLALDPFGDQRARRDRRAAAVGLEARVLDAAVGADLDLQLHHVAARGGADHAGADRVVALVERADVARVLVVIDDFVAICHVLLL